MYIVLQPETTEILFWKCEHAQLFWQWLALFNRVQINCDTLIDLWTAMHKCYNPYRHLFQIIFASVIWCIWLDRNRIFFDKKNPRPPKSLAALMISYVLRWLNGIHA